MNSRSAYSVIAFGILACWCVVILYIGGSLDYIDRPSRVKRRSSFNESIQETKIAYSSNFGYSEGKVKSEDGTAAAKDALLLADAKLRGAAFPKTKKLKGGVKLPFRKENVAKTSRYDPIRATSSQFDNCANLKSDKISHPFLSNYKNFNEYVSANNWTLGVDVECYEELPNIHRNYKSYSLSNSFSEAGPKQIGMGNYRSVHLLENGKEIIKDVFGSGRSSSVDNNDLNIELNGLTRYDKEVIVMIELEDSPHIIPLNSVKCDFDGSFIQPASSMMLRNYVSTYHKELSDLQKLDVMIQVAKGISELHEYDVISTDVDIKQFTVTFIQGDEDSIWGQPPDSPPKPFVHHQDFNRARFIERLPDGTKCDTKPISGAGGKKRAPEEYNRLYLTEKVDVFSLGYVIYELLTGNRPFSHSEKYREGDRTYSVAEAIAKGKWSHPISKVYYNDESAWQKSVVDLVSNCWAYEPNDRPSASEIVDELEAIFEREKSKRKEISE